VRVPALALSVTSFSARLRASLVLYIQSPARPPIQSAASQAFIAPLTTLRIITSHSPRQPQSACELVAVQTAPSYAPPTRPYSAASQIYAREDHCAHPPLRSPLLPRVLVGTGHDGSDSLGARSGQGMFAQRCPPPPHLCVRFCICFTPSSPALAPCAACAQAIRERCVC
jgi:hypothetical protein